MYRESWHNIEVSNVFRLCCFQNVGDLETIPEDPVEMNGAGHASRKGSTSNEFDVVR